MERLNSTGFGGEDAERVAVPEDGQSEKREDVMRMLLKLMFRLEGILRK